MTNNYKPFDFYVLTPIILTISGMEYEIELSLFGNFQVENNIPFVPVPNKFLIEKINQNGCERADKKTFDLINKFTTKFFKDNPEKFKKLALEELNAFGMTCVRNQLTKAKIKSRV